MPQIQQKTVLANSTNALIMYSINGISKYTVEIKWTEYRNNGIGKYKTCTYYSNNGIGKYQHALNVITTVSAHTNMH